MACQATVICVMIASTGDVPEERDTIEQVIHNWSVVHSSERKIVLLPVRWETHSYPNQEQRPQGFINDHLLRDCDLLVWIKLSG